MNETYEIIITENAEQDLKEIILYVAQRDIKIALDIYERLQAKAFSLRTFPEKGRIVPELNDHNIFQYHEVIENPWRIIYKIENNQVLIITVLDGRRNVEDILLKKLM
jgi:toxin ParE1/3/4